MNTEASITLFTSIALIFFIGFMASRQQKTNQSFILDYYLGGRSLGGFVLAMTMTATYGSASSFIGGPGVAYNEGLGWVLLSVTQVATGYFTLMILGKKFALITKQYRAVTMVDFLKTRYQSKPVVILSALSIIVFLFSAMAAQWIGGARLIESLTGLSYHTALLIFVVTVLIYVTFGGFRAVTFTDAIQGSIMFIGTFILLIAIIIAGGGISSIMTDLQTENPNLISPFGADGSLTPTYVSSYWVLVGVGVVALPQIAVRAMSYQNARSYHRALIIGTVVVGVIMLNMHLIGVFARPILPGIEVGDKVMPLVALEVLPAWLSGIVLAAPLAAIMSTVDSLLLLVSSSIVKDVYINYINPAVSQRHVRRLSIIITGVLGIIVYLLAVQPPDLIIWLNLFAIGGLEAVFIWPIVLGLYWKNANKDGALASMIAGMASYMIFETFSPNPFGMHSVVTSMALALIAFICFSLVGNKYRQQRASFTN
ncbi:sodium/panthothenate symporter [Gracilibacillus halophilus YIM-C55.5]|uniref:Sodium/panthothenate symporter n=1 Tax=Gracilibacillus halophilus YIM-C55.5 TaxID=1308866 RepID=N4WIG6_9BACI|nr:sodium/pantothenate symporter [Gracilibacillus halophilus]ENH95967.1 sodium/panthothenate symporter [Gracilibacillus halophilus YIM-C55.5]